MQPVTAQLQQARSLATLSLASVLFVAAIGCGTKSPREHFGRSGPKSPTARDDAGPSAQPNDAGAISDAGSVAPMVDVRAACGAPPSVTGDFSRERLRDASAQCAMYRYCAFQANAKALETAVSSYADHRDDASLRAARAAWREAMAEWSQAELFQFGPAASAAESAGKDVYQGKGLRDRIYAWPSTAQCRVEEQVLARPRTLDGVLISGRGLFALEFTLFGTSATSACAASTEIAKSWVALSEDARTERSAEYARTLAADIRTQAEALVGVWSPEGGNFKDKFVRATAYPDEQTALNVLAWALVYIEKEVKDWKLGIPAGFTLTSPVSGPESPYARTGTENIRANLRGFRALFQGCGESNEGVGFDDWLRAADHGELADALLEALAGAEAEIDALGPLDRASKARVEKAYQTLRKLTDLLKSDLFGAGSPLNLKLPASVEGDTD